MGRGFLDEQTPDFQARFTYLTALNQLSDFANSQGMTWASFYDQHYGANRYAGAFPIGNTALDANVLRVAVPVLVGVVSPEALVILGAIAAGAVLGNVLYDLTKEKPYLTKGGGENVGKQWHAGHDHYDKQTKRHEDPHVYDLTKHTDPNTGKTRIRRGAGRAPQPGEGPEGN